MDKNVRYDRQLRLWAEDGQSRLEDALLCVVGLTPAGSETLKNLVLPGLGKFAIVSNEKVTEDSLSGNFFFDNSDIGRPLCEAVTEKLVEMNPEVKGEGLQLPVEVAADVIGGYDVVVADNLPLKHLEVLKDRAWVLGIPLVVVNTCGFYGSVQIHTAETTIVETHDPLNLYDLRIDQPWPELKSFVDSFDFDQLSDIDHAHVPYVVIFIKALEKWRNDHNGSAPETYQHKKQFRLDYVEALARSLVLEANFTEASQAVHRALQKTAVPEYLSKVFQLQHLQDLNLDTPIFWLLVASLKKFVQKHSVLPLQGTLPDMASNTENYIALMEIYKNKARLDQENFTIYLDEILRSAGRKDQISSSMVATFCKNAAFLHVSYGSKDLLLTNLISHLLLGPSALAIHPILLSLRSEPVSKEQFLQKLEGFLGRLPQHVLDLATEAFIHRNPAYHNVCSFIGGVAGQEILKIATAQYIPLDNLLVYDGLRAVTERWKVGPL